MSLENIPLTKVDDKATQFGNLLNQRQFSIPTHPTPDKGLMIAGFNFCENTPEEALVLTFMLPNMGNEKLRLWLLPTSADKLFAAQANGIATFDLPQDILEAICHLWCEENFSTTQLNSFVLTNITRYQKTEENKQVISLLATNEQLLSGKITTCPPSVNCQDRTQKAENNVTAPCFISMSQRFALCYLPEFGKLTQHNNDISVAVAYRLGCTELNLNQFLDLESGDVLLLPDLQCNEIPVCITINNKTQWSAVYRDNNIIVSTILTSGTAMNSEQSPSEREDNASSINIEDDAIFDDVNEDDEYFSGDDTPEEERITSAQHTPDVDDAEVSDVNDDTPETSPAVTKSTELQSINIPIEFELAGQNMTLAEASSIRAGFTFKLNPDAHQKIAIKINGKVHGTGELVNIEGVPGILIREWQ